MPAPPPLCPSHPIKARTQDDARLTARAQAINRNEGGEAFTTWKKDFEEVIGSDVQARSENSAEAAPRGGETSALCKLTTNWRTLIESHRGTLV